MITKSLLAGSALALALCASGMANANVVVDMSPDAIGGPAAGFDASNQADAQNFLLEFTLTSTETLDGADIYSQQGPALGTPVEIKFRSDVAGSPDVVNLLTFNSVLSAIDSMGSTADPSIQRLHADFASTAFAPGTYWFGMSGAPGLTENGVGIGWLIQFNVPGSDGAWQLNGDTRLFNFNNHAQFAFQLDGPGGVPEPASWALMLLGFGGLGAALRAQRRVSTATD